jgi:hypothetical protein
MQTANLDSSFDLHSDAFRLGPLAGRMTMPGIVLAVVGFGVAVVVGLRSLIGLIPPPEPLSLFFVLSLFFHSYLVAYVFYLSITLGALFFVLLHHLSRAGWSVTLRRVAEALSANMLLMAVLFLPLLDGMQYVYEWSRPLGERLPLGAKAAYLNPSAFTARFAIYFIVWCGLASFFRNRSIRQDQSGDVGLTLSMERLSAPGMIAFAVSITLCAVDLLMSLNPNWASTMIGVYFFAGVVLSGLVVITLLARWLQAGGRLAGAVTVEHYHDLGKLTFAFVFFWGYIAFSQYMLIWYANMPEETQFYMPRQIGPWMWVSLALVAFHLLIPFVALLSRSAKRQLGVLTFWAVWLLVAHLFDLFWLVMPNTFIQKIPAAIGEPNTPLPEALKHLLASNQSVYQVAERHADFMAAVKAPLEAPSLLVLVALVLGMGGLYVANTARALRTASLVPLQDPRLNESLAFENS